MAGIERSGDAASRLSTQTLSQAPITLTAYNYCHPPPFLASPKRDPVLQKSNLVKTLLSDELNIIETLSSMQLDTNDAFGGIHIKVAPTCKVMHFKFATCMLDSNSIKSWRVFDALRLRWGPVFDWQEVGRAFAVHCCTAPEPGIN
jgi:hypothetical protein